ncbi:hypothetical protein HNQ60_002147 [Povalibacter uvarum]|uniref:Porin n=1 Tax=Povalibacter uvarum TaxID=732238 RepID=A0A841HLN0_9GAMM|nr:hypothetical protein [Povalibacter uvarum]MBB6093269.1 hypothetical protein [Povalibacter uvarum]
MRFRISTIALAVAASLPALASAVDFSYSGFSTAAYAQSDTDLAQVGYIGQPDGIDSDGTFTTDSKLGVQVTAKFNDQFSATVQGVAYADLTADWEPHLDWAYVRYQPTSNLSARVGYLRAPTFMYSDSVFIGYANSWVRPPMEVYGLSPAYQLRGVDLSWRNNLGPVAVTVQPYYGDSKLDAGDPAMEIEVSEWAGMAVTGEVGSFMFRAGYASIELGTTTEQLVGPITTLRSMAALGCTGCAVDANALDLDGTKIKNINVGVQYDNGTSIAIAEVAQRDTDSYVTVAMNSAYVTYGHRFGSFMPYGTIAAARRDDSNMSSAIPAGSPFSPLAAVANSTLAGGNDDQDSYTLGVRYEVPSFSVLKGAIVKLQYDHIEAKEGNGMFINVQPGFDGDTDMISASFDFIF